jgi:hypothetical protein
VPGFLGINAANPIHAKCFEVTSSGSMNDSAITAPRAARRFTPRVSLTVGLFALFVACGGGDPAPGCTEPATGAPADVFCTGLYLHRSSSEHAPDAVPFTPGLTFWSDGAEKQRYLFLPPGSQIDTSSMDSWKFPVGTKAWKEFRVEGRLVETRLLWKRSETGWERATYIWDETGKSATMNTSKSPTLLPNGYEIPSAIKVCEKCHAGAADTLLGVEPVSLALSSAVGITLASLVSEGRLSAPPQRTSVTLPEDATGKAAAALGYMHANCGGCHATRGLSGFTQLHTRLRADQFWPADAANALPALTVEDTDAYKTGVEQPVMLPSLLTDFPDTKIIARGSHDKSLTWRLAHLRGIHQMPPIVSHAVDEAGTQKLAEWIDALGMK